MNLKLGETKIVRKTVVRKECSICNEPAVALCTYLMENARNNPCSSGYRGDDISWCSDKEQLACAEHLKEVENDAPMGMRLASVRQYSENRSYWFLEWKEEEVKEQLASDFLRQFQQELENKKPAQNAHRD